MKSKIAILLFATVCIYIVFNLNKWRSNEVLQWDKSGYYLYLPATFINHDLAHLAFYPGIAATYHPNADWVWFSINDIPETGRKLNKYPVGVSVFELPFFLVAHAYTTLTKQFPADGYSPPYLLAVCLATIFWVTLGLWLLRKFLLKYYSETTVLITLILISFGTNLYNYTAFDWGMSHSFSFFLFSAFLLYTQRWYDTAKNKHIVILGLVLGLVIITRPTNILIALVPLFWPFFSSAAYKNKLTFFSKNMAGLALAAIVCFCILLIQAAYWKYITGHWIYYSYTNEGFDFTAPKVWKGLFSYRKGWFVYTPLAFAGILGFIPLFMKNKKMAWPLILFFASTIYVVFSWHEWYYGGSFGCRVMVETLAVLGIPMAELISKLLQLKNEAVKNPVFILIGFLVMLNIFQTYQFLHGTITTDRMNGKYYWRVFGQQQASPEDWKYFENP